MKAEKGLPHIGTGPFCYQLGMKEEERERSDDEVDEEDHEEPAHDIPEIELRHSQHGNSPEGLDHVGHHVGPGKGNNGRSQANAQRFGRRENIGSFHSKLTTAGRDEVVEKPAIPVEPEGKGLRCGDCHKGICENGGEQSVFEEAEDSCIEGKLDDNPPDRLSCILCRFQE